MAEAKTKPTDAKVETFLNKVADEQKRKDSFVILELMQQATKRDAVMWGPAIVGFGSYHYKYESGHEGDAPMLAFSPRKQNLTLYVAHGFAKYDELMQKLGKHSVSKYCIYVKRLSDIDIPTLKKLFKESFAYMKKKYPK